MANVRFILKEPKSEDKTLIFLVFSFQGQRLRMSTGLKITPDRWDKGMQRVRRTRGNPELSGINNYLDKLGVTVNDCYVALLNSDASVSVDALRERVENNLSGNNRTPVEFTEYFDRYVEQLKRRGVVSTPLRTTCNIMKEYRPDIRFDDFDIGFYKDFVAYLQSNNYSKNYIGKQVSHIKRVLNEAYDEGLHENRKYKSVKFKSISEKVYNIYNTIEELEQMFNYDFSVTKYLEDTRDRYIISAFTGLRFSDYRGLRKANFTKDGEYIIQDMRKVSGRVVVPLHWMVRKVLDRRGWDLPRSITNQVMNRYLKDVGKQAGIDGEVIKTRTEGGRKVTRTFKKYELMTTHTARRSMATNMYLAGIPIITVSKLLGHANVKQTLDYIKISEIEVAMSLKDHPFFTFHT